MMDGIEGDLACGCVAVRNHDGWLLGESLIEPIPLTILAVVSDDPASWEEMLQMWPRHRTPVVPEFLSAVALQPAFFDQYGFVGRECLSMSFRMAEKEDDVSQVI